MDPEFIKILTRVVIVGGTIGIIGTIALIVAMRAFRMGDARGALVVAALLFFVLACCIVLLQFSFVK
ncbi:MAG TPA: hypothetical protein VJ853_11845 [Thermoanaerobaculia bacterium]|nr:hypothetical protein [Thermoanaerobaculia bacterium]